MRLLIIIITFVLTGYIKAQDIVFNFNPPDTSFMEIQNTKKVTLSDGKAQKEDEVTITSQIQIKKKSNGYTIKQTPIAMNSKRDGKPFQNPIFMFLTNTATTGDLDQSGRLLHVSGYEDLIHRAKKTLPANVVESLVLVANEEAMINKAKADWNARVSEFSGQKVFLGDMFSGEGKFPLPNGEVLTFYSVIKIEDTVEFEGKKCVRIKFKNSSQPDELASFMGYSEEETAEIFDFEINAGLSMEIKLSGDGERIMDPETMLIYHEKTFRRIRMKSEEIGDDSNIINTLETKEYTYEF